MKVCEQRSKEEAKAFILGEVYELVDRWDDNDKYRLCVETPSGKLILSSMTTGRWASLCSPEDWDKYKHVPNACLKINE